MRANRRVGASLLATVFATVASKLAPARWPLLCGIGLMPLSLDAQTVTLANLVVSATRTAEPPEHVPFSAIVVGGDALCTTPSTTLDGALRSVPGFTLFRRSDSLSANPTAQGVSLRGLGPSGASRSLVVLDGVPLNDPFGGWVAWSKVPREGLTGAELVRGGGATAWGNAALGGVVQLLTLDPASHPNRFTASYGDFQTRSAELLVTAPLGRASLQLSGRAFATDGFVLVAPEDRGPVDIPAWSRHGWLGGRWTQPLGDNTELIVTGRTYTEDRGNGTNYQRNSSEENFGSIELRARPSATFRWSGVAYAQDQSFSSTFSSVDATRTAETPASDQFDVPAEAFGAAWTGIWMQTNGAQTSAGTDLRRVEGETRENYSYSNGDFTRQRIAGGTQDFIGLFALHERPLGADWRLTLGGRLDSWHETDGHRRETERATGNVLRDDQYTDRNGTEFSPSAGLVWNPAGPWRLRAATQYSFRRPTLNELYRPFRVGNVITEANPALETEHVTSAELGAEYRSGPVVLGATVFWNRLTDAVGNVTLVRGPGTFANFGFIPAGGVGRQRLNLDEVRVQGIELSATWKPSAHLSIEGSYLYDDTEVRRADVAPVLVGKELAQVARNTGMLSAVWRATNKLTVIPRLRALSRQFEDDENQLILGAVAIIDLSVSYAFTPRFELFANAENLGDARIETGRSADGIVNTGTPRLIFGGVRSAW